MNSIYFFDQQIIFFTSFIFSSFRSTLNIKKQLLIILHLEEGAYGAWVSFLHILTFFGVKTEHKYFLTFLVSPNKQLSKTKHRNFGQVTDFTWSG